MAGEDNLIAIDIGSSAVKVTQVVTRGDRVVDVRRGYGQLPQDYDWEPGKDDSSIVQQALSRALEQADVKGRRVVCVIPRHQVTLRFAEFPPAKPEQLSRMAALEAEQHIPLPIDQTIIGNELMGTTPGPEGLVPVLIAAARREVIGHYISLLTGMELYPEQLTTDALCLFKLWKAQYPNDSAAFLVDIGARSLVMNLVDSESIRLSRAVPNGGIELTNAFQADLGTSFAQAENIKREQGLSALSGKESKVVEAWLNNLASEIKRSAMASAARSYQPAKIYLCGGGALVKGLSERLEQMTGWSVKNLTPPVGVVPDAEATGFSLAFAASQVISHKYGALNLLPPETKQEEETKRRKRNLTAVAIAVLIALLTFIAGSYITLNKREAKLKSLEAEWQSSKATLAEMQRLTDERDVLMEQLKYLNASYDTKHNVLDALLEMHQRAPKGIWLTNLMMDKDTSDETRRNYVMQLTGKAPDNGVVADLVSTMSETPGISNVALESARSASFAETQVVEFTLKCKYTEPDAMNINVSSEETEEAKE